MTSMKSMSVFLIAMAVFNAYAADGGDPPNEIKSEAAEAKQEVVEAKPESGALSIYRVITVMPPFFHGYAIDTINGTASEAPAKIANYVKQEKIDMGAIIRAEFDRQLQAMPDFANRKNKDAPSKIHLKFRYGISKFALSGYKPFLSLAVAAFDASGKELWKGSERVGAVAGLGSTPSMEYSEYFSSPDKFRSVFEAAAKVLVQSLLKKLNMHAEAR